MRILYVDDEPDIREIVAMSLELDPAFVVTTAASGNEALRHCANERPDIILLDVMMPEMDGPTTLERLRAVPQTADVPVIFITARASRSECARLTALGALGVITKPFEPLTLAAEVWQLAGGIAQ